MIGVDPVTFGPMWRFHWLKGGSDALLGRLSGDAALVEEQFATKYDLSKGKSFVALGQTGNRQRFTVIGEYRDPTLLTGFTRRRRAPSTRSCRATSATPSTSSPRASGDPGQTKAAVAAALKHVPDGQGADQGRVHRLAQEAGRPAPDADLRPAGRERHHLGLRHRQHAGAVGLRAHARDRHAARHRHDPPADAAHRALRERDHLDHRRHPGHGARRAVRLRRLDAPGLAGHHVLGALEPARGLPRSWPPSSAWSPPCCRRAAPRASTSSTPSTTNEPRGEQQRSDERPRPHAAAARHAPADPLARRARGARSGAARADRGDARRRSRTVLPPAISSCASAAAAGCCSRAGGVLVAAGALIFVLIVTGVSLLGVAIFAPGVLLLALAARLAALLLAVPARASRWPAGAPA